MKQSHYNELMKIAADLETEGDGAIAKSLRAALAALPSDARAPVAWVRYRSGGGFEGPIMDTDLRMCDTRRSFWTPLYAAPVAPAAAAQPDERAALTYPNDLTDELREVLGWPNFRCGPVAHVMRDAGD